MGWCEYFEQPQWGENWTPGTRVGAVASLRFRINNASGGEQFSGKYFDRSEWRKYAALALKRKLDPGADGKQRPGIKCTPGEMARNGEVIGNLCASTGAAGPEASVGVPCDGKPVTVTYGPETPLDNSGGGQVQEMAGGPRGVPTGYLREHKKEWPTPGGSATAEEHALAHLIHIETIREYISDDTDLSFRLNAWKGAVADTMFGAVNRPHSKYKEEFTKRNAPRLVAHERTRSRSRAEALKEWLDPADKVKCAPPPSGFGECRLEMEEEYSVDEYVTGLAPKKETGAGGAAEALPGRYLMPVWVCIKLTFTCKPRWPFIIPPLPPPPGAPEEQWREYFERVKKPPIGLPPPVWDIPDWGMSAQPASRSYGESSPVGDTLPGEPRYDSPKAAHERETGPVFDDGNALRGLEDCESDCGLPSRPRREQPVVPDQNSFSSWTGAFDECEVDGPDFWNAATVYNAMRQAGDL